jgi:hypothetical protein
MRTERMITDNIKQARTHKNYVHMKNLVGVLRYFSETNPYD